MPGLKIPLRATSIIPLEKTAPIKIPKLAVIIMVLKLKTFEPMAEFKKFTASLLTPTIKSMTAKINKILTKIRKIFIVVIFCFVRSKIKK